MQFVCQYGALLCNTSVKLKLKHPPLGIPQAFECAVCPERGEFERCLAREGNLNRIYLFFWRNTLVSFFGFCKVWQNLSLRRGISVLIGGAFERLFCPEGREFEQANLQKFKCPGGGCWSFDLTGSHNGNLACYVSSVKYSQSEVGGFAWRPTKFIDPVQVAACIEEDPEEASEVGLHELPITPVNFLSKTIRTRSGRAVTLSHRALSSY